MSNNPQNGSNADNGNKDRAYNVIVTGFGFINRIKEVKPQSGNPYLACDVGLMHGVGDNVSRVYLQCTVRGKNAIDVIRRNFTAANGVVEQSENTTVVASMKFGGIRPELFEYTKGEKKGTNGVALRSSLLDITWLKIGDQVVNLETVDQLGANGAETQAQPATEGEPAFVEEIRREFGQNGFVKLSKDHPQFEDRRQFLKSKGFTWDKQKEAWVQKETAPAQPAPPPEAPKHQINF